MNKLKPCPFCGGEAEFRVKTITNASGSAGYGFTIECSKCNLVLPKKYSVVFSMSHEGILKFSDERDEAVKVWNTRAEESEEE